MKLRRYLESEYGIKVDDSLPISGVTVKKFIKKIEERGTADNIIGNIDGYEFSGKKTVLAYLDGVASRIM
jgi:hypothetical protein